MFYYSCSVYLQRGFKIDPRRGVGEVDLNTSVDDMLRVVEAHIEVDEGDRDENGFSLNFDGALARIKKELDYCFSYQKDAYTVDSVELKVKVEDVVQMAVAFGEYLSLNDREAYINRFLDHVVSSGKGDDTAFLFNSTLFSNTSFILVLSCCRQHHGAPRNYYQVS